MQQTGVRSGVLLFVLGLFVLMRTVNQDQSGRTLIDHILGKTSSASASASSSSSAAAAASLPAAVAAPTAAQTAAAATNTTRAVTNPLSPVVTKAVSPFVRVTSSGIAGNSTAVVVHGGTF